MKVEELIEQAMQDIMQARTYITTNSIPVVRYRDRNTERGDAWVVCHATPNERLSPNHDLYRLLFEYMAVSKSQEDLKAVQLDDLIEECNDEIQQTLSTTTLQTAIDAITATSGITIDGLVPAVGVEQDGDYQAVAANVEIFFTYNKQ